MWTMIIGFVFLYINIKILQGRYFGKKSNVEGLILTSVIWCLYLYFITEILSINNRIATGSVRTSWAIFLVINIFLFAFLLYKEHNYIFTNLCIHLSKRGIALAVLFMAYSALIIYFAVNTVPYNSDSMVYHLARIFRWAKNGSVAHYATSNWRAIASTPFAEFVGLHIFLLESNDNLINLVQAFSFCGIVYMVYQIAGLIGCDKKARLLSALLFATLPIAFAESKTTQVDDFGALWLVYFVYMLLEFLYDEDLSNNIGRNKQNMFFLGLLLGFGYLTKPTLLPAAGIFTIWVIVELLRRNVPVMLIVKMGVITVISMCLLISPEILRNFITFNAISYNGVGARQIVGTIRPNYILVNFLKVVFSNLTAIYWTNIYWRFPSIVYKVGSVLRVNVDDPSIAETGIPFTVSHAPDYGCDTAVNFVIAILVIIFIIIQLFKLIFGKKRKRAWGYSSCAFLSFIAIQVIVRWEPYLSRYLIGYMALVAPAIGMQVQKLQEENRNGVYIRGIVTGMIIFVSLVEGTNMIDNARLSVLTNNSSNHIVQYFATGKDKYEDYKKIADILSIKGKNNKLSIGLDIMEGSLEYPLLKMIDQSVSEIEDVNVDNASAKYENTEYLPNYIIYIGNMKKNVYDKGYQCHGVSYRTFEKISDTCYLIAR